MIVPPDDPEPVCLPGGPDWCSVVRDALEEHAVQRAVDVALNYSGRVRIILNGSYQAHDDLARNETSRSGYIVDVEPFYSADKWMMAIYVRCGPEKTWTLKAPNGEACSFIGELQHILRDEDDQEAATDQG